MDATSSVTKDGEVSEDAKTPVAENKPETSLSDEISKQNKDTEVTESSHTNAVDTNNSSTKIGVSDRKGEAKIKAQYLLLDYKPKIDTEFVAKETQNALKHLNEENSENSSLEPPPKKLRLKGRNKKRPFEKKLQACEKLCGSIIQEKECAYGPKCIFLHDVKAFWESKPEDIGPECHLFTKFGRCPYSFSCRFARHHISESLENMVNKDIYEGVPLSRNSVNHLDKDVQRLLWKRKYDFSKSQKVLEDLNKKSSTNNVLEDGQKADMKKLDADSSSQNIGFVSDEDLIKLRPAEKKKIDFSNKLFLAPLTTVGNLPFRRLCKSYGADITCSEMAVATSLLQGKTEWALLKRHESEDIFGIQLCGAHVDSMTRCAQLIQENCKFDFVDINCGCPIELIYQKGEGCALMGRPSRLEQIVKGMKSVLEVPLTVKMRTGIQDGKNIAHTLIPKLTKVGVDLITIHGRSREQRYTKLADWDYINQCSQISETVPLFGNGDVLSFEDANSFLSNTYAKGIMIARGALIKPWIFTEIKEERHWDISSSERLDLLRQFVRNGFEHWGSDHQGVETTRRFLLEMLSFSHRYIPVGVLERVPQKINERPPYYVGRDDLETLMSSSNCRDWIKISEMLLGPVTENFQFLPKHKANAYK
ncbi:tRNA-dihydrouridine(47) synthase [NAD(P)(+)]-like [Octopus sinensis]|uniref:tRNA-dihydrouridine(47) synthase [NAD(P)(+)] n=1 Tax=Octopus sinensis TaxID=2607531 RepID=A0A6P7TS55_9MOLL|nr:tRNA-dihydrouridine(47) synthase [NAD(P)(+)]-like [Octopus sinensis]XP_036370662.1 tRNA-dihydrouridine(47) synthase [NAD(P)(+)]-like [Octopus sinensis]XP_036370663.1 tRNA-dihydrouridine(47) synthase [NAD(P)(+)]-like [Octopus sinensis]XP_036370664.1 tRNA-dihydrouridine(47) synthase [NAD(P)(+)]-like [Octopus sinensis]XP_036370665.1 tRNA-dihydrouridine(47) synthase [NAD(P)(+)]-like [Octopus sinensis]